MKNVILLRKVFMSLLFITVVVSCSSDDGGNSDYLANVPKGEIVPVAERQRALTGFDEDVAPRSSNTETQKWWKYIYGEVTYNCEGENETDEIEESGYYYAFFPNGKMYYKIGEEGTPNAYNDWEWANSSKSKLQITDQWGETLDFELTELNDDSVVYASYQSEQGCSLLTWEQLGSPVFD